MTTKTLLLSTILAAGPLLALPAIAQEDDAERVEETIVVTGVFSAKSIEQAPISVTAVTSDEIAQQVPASAADLLKNVPGVFVNSGLGEIRNVVFSRGVSANSLDAAGGYFYVSLQEDGLPVESLTLTNFGPDYFTRPDIMLDRLEGLRGGTATVTGANAPGGIFNYISRTGKSHPGFEVSTKLGLEGDGKNPYYRVDGYAGGELAEDLYYAVGGFYRTSDGARDAGYALNEGGQIRANLLWEYGQGSVQVNAKYLNDRNGWFEFLPANNYRNPAFAAGFDNYSSVLPPAGSFDFANPDGSNGSWDGSDLVQSTAMSVGLNWQHEFDGGIRLDNKMKLSRNEADWNTGAVIFALPVDEFFVSLLAGYLGVPGEITYRNQSDGSVAAVIQSFSGFDHTVTTNNLPNQSVLENGVFSQVAYDQQFEATEFSDQFTATFEVGRHTISAGGFVSLNSVDQTSGSGGVGISSLTNNPQMFDISVTTGDGTTYQVTNPAGFGAVGRGLFSGDGFSGDQNQYSLFVGDSWEVTDRFSVDGGLRYEKIDYDITNLTVNSYAGNILAEGGEDGDPLTLWDNGMNTYGAPTNVKRSFEFLSFTGSAAYVFTEDLSGYVRYTNGRKAPDFGLIQGIDTAEEIAAIFPEEQSLEQIELGLKYFRPNLRISAFPFYSKLSDIATSQAFTDENGQNYSPEPQYGTIETYGIEIDGEIDLTDTFVLRGAITLQDAQASGYSTWVANTPSRDDDTLVVVPDGDADNNPKIIVRSTGTWSPTEALSIFATYSYLGDRPANNYNAWTLPGFSTVDLGGSYQINERFRIQANVNNVFNEEGVLSWAKSGGFLASLDRQALTKADVSANPDQLFSVVTSQPRSFWLTASMSF